MVHASNKSVPLLNLFHIFDDCNVGPRFYVSIIEAGLKLHSDGKAGRPPTALMDILWPHKSDRHAPWITELGWTCVPPNSDMQQVVATCLFFLLYLLP